jgi:hypothetical protein
LLAVSEDDIPSAIKGLELDKDRLAAVWRIAAYTTANCLVAMQLNQLRAYRLRPVELLIFDIVALASVQRNFRELRHLDAATVDLRPTDESNGTISRRRVSDITGLPRATVARIVLRLIGRGMVHEVGRGHLQVPVGVVLQGQHSFDLSEMFTPLVLLMEQFARLGIVRQTCRSGGDTDDPRMGNVSFEAFPQFENFLELPCG